MLRVLPLLCLLVAPTRTDASPKEAGPVRLEEAPAAWAPALAKAKRAAGRLRERLQQRLEEALAAQGPVGAVTVCQEEAAALATEVAVQEGVELGRTSFRLRNPQNAPRAWAKGHVYAGEGKPAADVPAVVFERGKTLGVLLPIATGPLCLTCHGPKEGLSPELRRVLAARYPEDRAVGFKPGELRGYVWVELAKP